MTQLLAILLYVVCLPMVYAGPETVYVGDSLTDGYVPLLGCGQVFKWYEVTNSYTFFDQVPDGGTLFIELGVHETKGKNFLFTRDEASFALAYVKLVELASETHEPILVGIPWLDWNEERYARGQRFNQVIRQIADRRYLCFVDTWKVMEACGLECIGEDGFHPNELGYELIAQEMERCK